MSHQPHTTPADLPLVGAEESIRDAIAAIDRTGKGIALVVESDRRLRATVTDGDVRRAMLSGLPLDAKLADLVKARGERPAPAVAHVGASEADLVALMERAHVRQVPLLDDDGIVVGVVVFDDLVDVPPLRAVVMAGGFGRRLAPLTEEVPKPMLPLGNRPILEHIVNQLRDAGITQVNVTTNYLREVIEQYFGDGERFGVEIAYVPEEQPLGTAGALGLVEGEGPLLVMNADLLTRVDFRAMHQFHDEHDADMTVAVRPYDVTVPFGLVQLDDANVTAIDEKPLLRGFVNAGIYLVEAQARLVEPGERLDMPELIARLIGAGRRVVGFPLREYWLDIGRLADYEQATTAVAGNTDR
jgi:dTDP-glucose pyrophosphorylase/CBS domain-containing protein